MGSRQDDKQKADSGWEEKHMLRWYRHMLVTMNTYTSIYPFHSMGRRPVPVDERMSVKLPWSGQRGCLSNCPSVHLELFLNMLVKVPLHVSTFPTALNPNF
jgi:hypothetical protein